MLNAMCNRAYFQQQPSMSFDLLACPFSWEKSALEVNTGSNASRIGDQLDKR